MLLSTLLVGHFADRGWTQSLLKSYLAGCMGSCVTFACGLSVLAFFLPADQLLMAGLLPFLPGDFIKTLTAAAIAFGLNKAHRSTSIADCG
jgi:biotin transport system substrate-specific component